MKNKFLSFVLAFCLILPALFTLIGCGGGNGEKPHTHSWYPSLSYDSTYHWYDCNGCDEIKQKATHDFEGDACTSCGYTRAHTHTWPSSYLKDDTHHWKVCSGGCGQSSAKAEHDYENNVCKDCGYYSPDAGLEMISSVRDLEVITYDTGSGMFTLVCLPDWKYMVIDSGNDSFDTNMFVEDQILYTYGASTIDYFVLTNTSDLRTGQASYIVQNYEVKNFYIPREINNSAPTCYKSALANMPASCNKQEVGETNCDITYRFKDGDGNIHSYTIDFMLPTETSNCSTAEDAAIAISIEYAGKTVLLSSDATNNNIDGYVNKYNKTKNVDILITSYLSSQTEAITGAEQRGKDYFESISLESSEYIILTSTSADVDMTNLKTYLSTDGFSNIIELADSESKIVKITSAGELSCLSNQN